MRPDYTTDGGGGGTFVERGKGSRARLRLPDWPRLKQDVFGLSSVHDACFTITNEKQAVI